MCRSLSVIPVVFLLALAGCGKKSTSPAASSAADAPAPASTPAPPDVDKPPIKQPVPVPVPTTAAAPANGARAGGSIASKLQCSIKDGGPVGGPDCVTADIQCGETMIGHTKGGVQRYDTRFYERNTCWPGTRNHNGGDERVYRFVADGSPRFKAGETRQRVTVTFNSPCADLSFTKMLGSLSTCPTDSARLCDTENPFTRKNGMSTTNITVDAGEVYYFLVEGADEQEGAFSIQLECGT